MPALKPVSRRELVRKLKALGFEGPFPGGKHDWMRRDGLRVTIPNPHGGAIDPGLKASPRGDSAVVMLTDKGQKVLSGSKTKLGKSTTSQRTSDGKRTNGHP